MMSSKQELNEVILGFDVFGINLGDIVNAETRKLGEGISCHLQRQRDSKKIKALNLFIREVYQVEDSFHLALFEIENDAFSDKVIANSRKFTLETYLSRKHLNGS